MEVETRTVETTDGRELCLEIAGEASERTILVHNGTPNSRHLYPSWIEDASSRGAQLISYDRPGYGGSSPHPGHSIADNAADVQTIAEALEIDRLAVWGLSGGGPPTLACAALLSDLVVAAAVIGSGAPWDAPGLDFFDGMGEANAEGIRSYFEDPGADRQKVREAWEERVNITGEQVLEAWATLLSEVDAAALRGEFAEFVARCMRDGLAPSEQGWWEDGVAYLSPWGFDLESIRVPVKVLHGRHDRFVPFQHGEWLAEHIPGAEADLSETDGHLTLLANRIPDVHEWLLRRW